MKKRFLPLLLALCMVFTLLPASVSAAELVDSGTFGDGFAWTLDADGLLTISGTGSMPDSHPWSDHQSEVKSLCLEPGITRLPTYAFDSYKALQSVSFPDTLQGIGTWAFFNTGLTEVVIPENTSVGDGAFESCRALETVVLPSTAWLANSVFANCTALTFVVIPDGFTRINNYTFENCKSLEAVFLPSSITEINYRAFNGCENLKYIFYTGNEDQLSQIRISEANDPILNADVYLIPSLPDPIYGFFDMPARSSWAYPGIAYCLDHGLMNGVSDTEFDPDGTLTRAMLVTVLWRLAGEPAATQDCAFPDLGSPNDPAASWYLDTVAWAAEAGIVNGRPDGTFDPKGAITRQELATMLYRFAGVMKLDTSAKGDLSVFPDDDQVLAYAVDAMTWANGAGLVKGNSRDGVNYLDPWGNATRAQVATILMRFCENVAQ